MQVIADKITKELKALIEEQKSNVAMLRLGDDDFTWNDFNKRRNAVIETILFLHEELKPYEKQILDLVNELEGRTDE